MAEQILAIDDPAGLLLEGVRLRALAAAKAMLEHKGLTVEQCAAIGTKPAKPSPPQHYPQLLRWYGGSFCRVAGGLRCRAEPMRAGREAANREKAGAAAALTRKKKPARRGLRREKPSGQAAKAPGSFEHRRGGRLSTFGKRGAASCHEAVIAYSFACN